MHIHLPKPLHGWKEFLNEIFVIVVGVLIALGFEQVVEQWHWHHEIEDARETINAEVAQDLLALQMRLDSATCSDANLAELARRVAANDAAAVRDMAAQLSKLMPTTLLVVSTNWDLANNSGLLAHMAPAQKQALADAYGAFLIEGRYLNLGNEQLSEAVARASVFEGTAAARERLLEQLALIARYRLRRGMYPAMIARIKDRTGIAPGTVAEVKERIGLFTFNPCTRFDQVGAAAKGSR